MSFSAEVKKELTEVLPSDRAGRSAELAGFLCMGGSVSFLDKRGPALVVFAENDFAAEKCFTLIRKTLRINMVASQLPHPVIRGKSLYRLTAPSPEDAERILAGCVKTEGRSIPEEGEWEPLPELFARSAARRSFLRGAFLAAGSVSDPHRSYHLEFVCDRPSQADLLTGLMRGAGLSAKRTERKGRALVYLKEGSDITSLLGMMGAPKALMEMENVRILKEISGDVNRRVNCETANLQKTVAASVSQTEAIEFLRDTVGLSRIPKGLREIAQLRLDMPDASLAELGEAMTPPIGKSGVNHRLRKIKALADSLRS